MSSTTKTVLLVGGAAVAAFILLRALAPAPATRPATRSSGVTLRGIVDLGSAIGSGVRQLFADAPVTTYPQDVDGVSTADFQAGHFGVDYS